jgi:hypothetical protein
MQSIYKPKNALSGHQTPRLLTWRLRVVSLDGCTNNKKCMKPMARWCCLGVALAQLLGHAATSSSDARVALVRVPDRGVQPEALVDAQGTLHLVYLAGDPKACDVMYVRRPPGQTNFSSPLRVNSQPGSAIAMGTVRGAQLSLGRNRRVHVVWNGSERASTGPAGGAPMLYSRLNDSGDAFEPQRDIMTSTTHLDGGGSVAANTDGRVYVVWHGHKTRGPQEEIDRGVFVAFSRDEGKTFSAERQVDPAETGVCGCCGLKAFADGHGSLAILYRSANQNGNRDSTLLLSTDYGVSFTTELLGQWHVSTCPMSTQALGQGRHALLAMFEKEDQIYLASILPNRREAIASMVGPPGNQGARKHPTFAVGKTKAAPLLLAWTEGTGWEKGGALAWQCINAGGHVRASGRVEGVPVWSFAAAVPEPDGSFTIIY